MKVLQIIDSLGIGGAEKLIIDLVPVLNKNNIKTDVLLLKGEQTEFYKNLKNQNICNIFSLGNSIYNPLYIFKIIPYLRKYDVVHVHLFPAQYFAVLAKVISFSKVKLVFTEHSTGNKRLHNPSTRRLEKWIYKYFVKIICITKEVKKVLIEKLNIDSQKLLVVENGIDLDKINKASKADRSVFGYDNNDLILIMTAGFREQKDQDTVIKTLEKLPAQYKLLLIGDGERRSILENLAHSLNVANRVQFLGTRDDVYPLTKMADIAVLSSHWEGFGLAAAEAMACGTPTIASNVPGLAQVVENGGFLFERGNVENLKMKIESLRDLKIYNEVKLSGINKAKQYSLHFMIEKIMNIYKSL